ncbi:MAG: hypothetical protein U1E73_02925 [Planctomycetota bacterium]
MVVLALAAAAALALFGYHEWQRRHVTIGFARADGPVPALDLTVYPEQLAFASPSPPPPLATMRATSARVTFGRPAVPGRAVVRYSGEGVGTGVVFVELGKEMPAVELTKPRTIRGGVGTPGWTWGLGWHVPLWVPIAGAEVLAMAGGEHGIPVGAAVTGSDGRFAIDGIASNIAALSLRVLAPGHAIRHIEVPRNGDVMAAVKRTRLVRGTLVAPPGLDLARLTLVARGLPGVQTVPAADGSFVLDNLPLDFAPRLIVCGLDAFHAQREVRARRDTPVDIEILAAGVVRGRVVDKETLQAIPDAIVFVGSGDAVRSAADGSFELAHVSPGEVEITAQWQQPKKRQKRAPVRLGHVRAMIAAGAVVDGIVVPIE